MPKKGYKPSLKHRRHLSSSKKKFYERARAAMDTVSTQQANRKKFVNPKPDTTSTPVPPSASAIRSDLLQRWACYTHNEAGKYFYKRESADTLKALYKKIQELDIPAPLWSFVKSGREESELFMPIRIPEEAVKVLGQRFAELKDKRGAHGIS